MKPENNVKLSASEQRWLQRGESLGEQLDELRKRSKKFTETMANDGSLQDDLLGKKAAKLQQSNKS